jgi:hypothetical protein
MLVAPYAPNGPSHMKGAGERSSQGGSGARLTEHRQGRQDSWRR